MLDVYAHTSIHDHNQLGIQNYWNTSSACDSSVLHVHNPDTRRKVHEQCSCCINIIGMYVLSHLNSIWLEQERIMRIGKGERSAKRPRSKLKFQNILTVVELLNLATCYI